MSSGFASEASTRKSSVDISFSDSDIGFTEFDMDLNVDNAASQANENKTASSNTEQGNGNVVTMERDPIYFCENVVLAAEDRLFCVPKGGLADHGTYFQSLFSKQDSQLPVAGSSEQHPIVLEGVSKIHFHNFLRAIVTDSDWAMGSSYGVDVPFGDEHWIGILDLATKWGFQAVRETAITHLGHLFTSSSSRHDPIAALFLCQKYDVQKYMKQEFEAIITSIKVPDSSAMLAGGINTDTVLLLKDLRDRWMSGMLWGDRGFRTSNVLPRRLSARKIVEDYFAALGPRPMSQEERNLDTCCVQDEAKRLEHEVRSLEEGERHDAVGVEDDLEAKGEEESEGREKDDTPDQPGPSGVEDLLDDASPSISEVDEFPDDTGARIEKLILLHSDKRRVAELIQELKGKGANDVDLRVQALANEMEAHDRKLQEYWGKVTSSRSQSQTWSDILASCNTQHGLVDLGGHGALSSRQILEQLVLDQLHRLQNLLISSSLSVAAVSIHKYENL
ncbi:hypothetical protein BJ165DRAFT_1402068 [Panaeolus papilionaceus]|nr:hypothetical protein BJ165DRAFT_1402068 [Panaeolus papilionaceus]